MNRHGWSQAELARRAGIAQKTISNIERGGGGRESVTLSSVEAIADVFKVPPWRLMLPYEGYLEAGLDGVVQGYTGSSEAGKRILERIADIESRHVD